MLVAWTRRVGDSGVKGCGAGWKDCLPPPLSGLSRHRCTWCVWGRLCVYPPSSPSLGGRVGGACVRVCVCAREWLVVVVMTVGVFVLSIPICGGENDVEEPPLNPVPHFLDAIEVSGAF